MENKEEHSSTRLKYENHLDEEVSRPKAAVLPEHHATKKHKWPKRVALALLAVVIAGAVGFTVYVSDYYHASESATQQSEAWMDTDTSSNAFIAESASVIAVGNSSAEYGMVFYPGGKVEAAAYIPLACDLAEQGIYCVIAKMPFNLAFLNADAANAVVSANPNIKHWWIGGHSLGGVAAATHAASNASKYEGIALLAAYSTKDLSSSNLAGLAMYGSNDQVLDLSAFNENAANLPANTAIQIIQGGNHANFGSYGTQKGDGTATIPAEEQQHITAEAIAQAMRG